MPQRFAMGLSLILKVELTPRVWRWGKIGGHAKCNLARTSKFSSFFIKSTLAVLFLVFDEIWCSIHVEISFVSISKCRKGHWEGIGKYSRGCVRNNQLGSHERNVKYFNINSSNKILNHEFLTQTRATSHQLL